ncbi:hypothetical protein (doubtful CDS) [Clavibacter sepedonicus]|uniref:Uncharacterized protein n=1 Tax=Clavibacter sepedonicus TaxID=31964 RepID=B0RGG5_CLASE|nr:hypothetical protein (doubtful CDS) [Clavibacter sepedonicus]
MQYSDAILEIIKQVWQANVVEQFRQRRIDEFSGKMALRVKPVPSATVIPSW